MDEEDPRPQQRNRQHTTAANTLASEQNTEAFLSQAGSSRGPVAGLLPPAFAAEEAAQPAKPAHRRTSTE